MDWRHQLELLTAGRAAYAELKNLCVWAKDNGGHGLLLPQPARAGVRLQARQAPTATTSSSGGIRPRTARTSGSISSPNAFGRRAEEGKLLALHPTVKPVGLVADAILDAPRVAILCSIPSSAAATTLIAAERVGRRCYGMELDPLYVDTIIRRWQAFSGDEVATRASGKSFKDLEEEAREGNATEQSPNTRSVTGGRRRAAASGRANRAIPRGAQGLQEFRDGDRRRSSGGGSWSTKTAGVEKSPSRKRWSNNWLTKRYRGIRVLLQLTLAGDPTVCRLAPLLCAGEYRRADHQVMRQIQGRLLRAASGGKRNRTMKLTPAEYHAHAAPGF